MESHESSPTTRDEQKPSIAAKPQLDFRISTTASDKGLICLTVSADRDRTFATKRRRCKSFHQEFIVDENNSNLLSDSCMSGSLQHLDTIDNRTQVDVRNADMFPVINDPCEVNNAINSNKVILHVIGSSEEMTDSINNNSNDVMFLKNIGLTCDISSPEDELVAHELQTSNLATRLHVEVEPEETSYNEHFKESNFEKIVIQNLNEDNLNIDDHEVTSNEEERNISMHIPDIIFDHVIPKALSSVVNVHNNSNFPNSPIGITSNADEVNTTPEEDPQVNTARERRVDDDDDDDDELVDLQSRRAVLRGHSVRISHSLHRRHPSRLLSIADSLVHRSATSSSQASGQQQPSNHLPKGWESRIDIHGRVFYIDHINRCTTWKKPESQPSINQGTPSISEEDRRLMDRRYQSLRRSLRARPIGVLGNPLTAGHDPTLESPLEHLQKFDEDGDPVLPGAVFLSRPDFFTLMQNNQVAREEYNQNSSIKHMVNKIRRDYSAFKLLQHRKDLVAFVNHFAEPNRPFPENWEMKMDKSNKPYYIDHTLKVTTYIDPRLPPLPHFHADILRGPNRSSLSQLQEAQEGHFEYHDRVVSFLRQTDILDILKSKYPAILSNMSLKNKVNMIRSEGQQAILKLKNDLELTVMLSIFEEDIMTYVAADGPSTSESQSAAMKTSSQSAHHRSSEKKRNLDNKLNEFYAKLDDRGYCKGNIKYRLIIRRDRLLQDGYDKVMSLTKKELQRSKIIIAFKGEDALDYGGPSREFFFLLSRELFNPYYGLFAYSANDTYTVQVSPTSNQIENYLGWFRFAGRIIALALVHQYLLDVFFTRVFYKQLLHLKPCLSDLESLDLEFYRSLAWINDKATAEELENMCLTFSVTEETEDDESVVEDSLDDDFKKESRKGLLGWFDGFVKRTYSDHERRSKSNPRNRPSAAVSALNINSASASIEYSNNFLSPPRRIPAHLDSPIRNANRSTHNATSISIPNLLTSGSKSTECLASSVGASSKHVPRIIERELKPNGRSVAVTEKNRKDYIERMISWRVRRGTQRQMESLIHGFNEILDSKLMSRFDAHELELVIAGSVEIDIQDWRMNTVYKSGYSDNHQVIGWFWNVVASYDNDQRLRLLQFVTGTSSIPVEGFSALRGSTGPKRFCIEKWGKVTDLPRAHTCFNRLDLPPYTSYGLLLEKLTIAVEETSAFGIE